MYRIFLLSALVACGGKDDDTGAQPTDTDTTTPSEIPDDDDDGFGDLAAGGDDCDDADPAVNPGADEVCDGIDNDCDGTMDLEPVAPLYYADADLDGYGDPSTGVGSCFPLAGHVEDATDCDDTLGDVHPGAIEACNDRDDDCAAGTGEDGVISLNGAGSYPSVQAAVDAGVNGAVLDLCPGTYEEAIIADRGLVWFGHGGRDAVFLDGRGVAPTLRVTDGLLTRIEGITLQNGTGDYGGCLSVLGGDLELMDARLTGCAAAQGGGLYFTGDQVFAERVEITDNSATLEGGGVWGGFNAELRLTDALVSGNTAAVGAGLYGLQSSDLILSDVDVTGNAASVLGGGLALFDGSTLVWTAGALTSNTAPDGGGVLLDGSTADFSVVDLGAGATDTLTGDVFVVAIGQGWSWDGVTTVGCDAAGCE